MALVLGSVPINADGVPPPLDEGIFLQVEPTQARLGRQLFFDPILSGNKNISCASCHSSSHGGGDGVALGYGEGGVGIGPLRQKGSAVRRQQRNAPALWNLGAAEVKVLFHDGRVEDLGGGQFRTPAGAQLPKGLNSVLAAQALFPMIAQTEMAGDVGSNEVATAAAQNVRSGWSVIAARVAGNADYLAMFQQAFPEIKGPQDVSIVHVANALAGYIGLRWRSVNAPFDRFLNGDEDAISREQKSGMALFYGKGGCAVCHSGPLFSDQKFYSIGLPNIGPGRTQVFDPIARDRGRLAVTDNSKDAYRFRTPFLRNVELTAPYGHNGAIADLESIIAYHADPQRGMLRWRRETEAEHLQGLFVPDNPQERRRIAQTIDLETNLLTETEISELASFLKSLTFVPALIE